MLPSSGKRLAESHFMAKRTLEERVAAIEVQLAGKPLQAHFREQAELIDRRLADSFRDQAELIDRLFIYRLDEMDKRWDAKLDVRFDKFEAKLEAKLETKLEAKLEAKLEPIRRDLGAIKDAVKIILTRLP